MRGMDRGTAEEDDRSRVRKLPPGRLSSRGAGRLGVAGAVVPRVWPRNELGRLTREE